MEISALILQDPLSFSVVYYDFHLTPESLFYVSNLSRNSLTFQALLGFIETSMPWAVFFATSIPSRISSLATLMASSFKWDGKPRFKLSIGVCFFPKYPWVYRCHRILNLTCSRSLFKTDTQLYLLWYDKYKYLVTFSVYMLPVYICYQNGKWCE